jgi:ribonuclease J
MLKKAQKTEEMGKTSLTFYGGLNEIGGNKILLEDRDARVFLDFGMSFAGEERFFSGYLTPRGVNGAGDYLEFDLLPQLKGLYAQDMIKNTSINYEEPRVDAVFLSHSHMDHVGYLPFIDGKIPVYCGECTKLIMDAMQESGKINLGEHKFRLFRTGKKIKLGNLEIVPIHVDHSVPGAYGFVVHTSQGSIVYSGDYRLHGPLSKMTDEFAEKAAECSPDLMLSEGTRVCPKEGQAIHSETRVRDESNAIMANASQLVVVAFYSRDIDRFKTFYEIAKNNDRKFVIPIKLAHLLSKLKTDPVLKIPDVMKDENILFYKKRKKTGAFAESDYYTWERPFIDKAVNYEYVHKYESKLLFNLDLVGFTELIDIRPTIGGDFIHSMSEPFSEEDVSKDVLDNWLSHFGLRFHQIHASGHCQSKDLVGIINRIKPKRLIPIHTEHPNLFKDLFQSFDVVIAEKGKPYSV